MVEDRQIWMPSIAMIVDDGKRISVKPYTGQILQTPRKLEVRLFSDIHFCGRTVEYFTTMSDQELINFLLVAKFRGVHASSHPQSSPNSRDRILKSKLQATTAIRFV